MHPHPTNRSKLTAKPRRALLAVVSTVLTLAFAPLAWAAESKPDVQIEPVPFSYIAPDIREKMLAQQPLTKAANTLRHAIEVGDANGFSGIALEDHAVVLWWKGTPGATLVEALARAREIAPVEIRAAAYSRAELRAAAAVIGEKMKADPAGAVHSIEIPVDGSGLVIGTERSSVQANQSLPALQVPVKIQEKPRFYLNGRYNDVAPFWGGSAIINQDNGVRCTAGFGVRTAGYKYLLTAGHCGRAGGGWWNGDRSLSIGIASQENTAHDLLLIRTRAGRGIYDGPVNTAYSKGVAGWDWAYANEYVCQSGSTSGTVCGIQNSTNSAFQFCAPGLYGGYECYSDLVLAKKVDGSVASRGGDSGGPVFTLYGSDRVIAKGTLTGGGSDGTCADCLFVYQDFGTAWRDFGVTPLTTSSW